MSVVRAMQGGDMIAGKATHVTVKVLRDVESSVSNWFESRASALVPLRNAHLLLTTACVAKRGIVRTFVEHVPRRVDKLATSFL